MDNEEKTILVTGGSGFIGSAITNFLVKKWEKVCTNFIMSK